MTHEHTEARNNFP